MKKKVVYGIIVVFFLIFGGKLYFIKKDSNVYLQKLDNRVNVVVEGSSAPRGRILDSKGKVLVDNKGVKTIYYNKIKGIKVSDELDIAKKLAQILTDIKGSKNDLIEYYLVTHNDGYDLITDAEYEDLERRKIKLSDINKWKRERVTDEMISYDEEEKEVAYIYALMNKGYYYNKKEIKSNVLESEYAKVLESSIPGVTGEMSWVRVYPYGDTLKNILGSVGSIKKEEKDEYLKKGYQLTDVVGVSYLEKEYEEYLRGSKAEYQVLGDYTLEKIKDEQKGQDLVLAIDIELQLKVEEILREKISQGQGFENAEYYKDSYAIVSEPMTGKILAIGGQRLNDDGNFSDISLNTINKSYTIGSAVKGATIGVGYKYNLIEPGEVMRDACVKLKFVPKKCSYKSLGNVNDLRALAESSNYYQYMIAIRLTGNDYKYNMSLNATEEHFKMYRDLLASFGLGVKTGIDLPGETEGIMGKTVADDLLLNLAIGQYDTYTPMEVMQYINSVASGKRLKLNLASVIGGKEYTPVVLNDVDLNHEYLDRIREGLKLVLKEGTGRFYVPQGLDFAGKTGTSESFFDSDGDGVVDVATITSTFTGFYPSDNPKYSIVVITPNISHKEGKTNKKYTGAIKITKAIVEYLESKS